MHFLLSSLPLSNTFKGFLNSEIFTAHTSVIIVNNITTMATKNCLTALHSLTERCHIVTVEVDVETLYTVYVQ